MNTYESIETRLTNGGTQRLTCLVMHPVRRNRRIITALICGIVIGYAAGVITYCWIHILTTVN